LESVTDDAKATEFNQLKHISIFFVIAVKSIIDGQSADYIAVLGLDMDMDFQAVLAPMAGALRR